jgi:hypothetical protein
MLSNGDYAKPNHFHCIIENTITEATVGTDPMSLS